MSSSRSLSSHTAQPDRAPSLIPLVLSCLPPSHALRHSHPRQPSALPPWIFGLTSPCCVGEVPSLSTEGGRYPGSSTEYTESPYTAVSSRSGFPKLPRRPPDTTSDCTPLWRPSRQIKGPLHSFHP
ncbi:hypothetical protein P7C73_g2011, partial [Tremellales sp. Uapishka_1]